MTVVDSEPRYLATIGRLVAMLPYFPDRKLAVCPVCEAGTVWTNMAEFGAHVVACTRIKIGVG